VYKKKNSDSQKKYFALTYILLFYTKLIEFLVHILLFLVYTYLHEFFYNFLGRNNNLTLISKYIFCYGSTAATTSVLLTHRCFPKSNFILDDFHYVFSRWRWVKLNGVVLSIHEMKSGINQPPVYRAQYFFSRRRPLSSPRSLGFRHALKNLNIKKVYRAQHFVPIFFKTT